MSIQSRFKNLSLPLATAILATLSACGGGGSDAAGLELPCGGTQTLNLSITYEVNGVLVDASRPVFLPRGMPTLAVPRIVGLPAACFGAARLTVLPDTTTSPNDMSFDRQTGIISGTANIRGSFDIQLKLTVDGYINPVFQNVIFFL